MAQWNVQLPKAEWYDSSSPELVEIVNEVVAQKVVAIDTETTGLVVWKDMPLFWSLSWGNRRLCMPTETLPRFADAFAQADRTWVFANAKFDMHMLRNAGIGFEGRIHDTQVIHALLYEEKPHSLDAMGKQLLSFQWKDLFDDWKKGREEVGEFLMRLFKTDPRKLIEYASNDAYGTLCIYNKLMEEAQRTRIHSLWPDIYPTMWALFEKVEARFTKVLWKCESRGIKIDQAYLASKESAVDAELDKVQRAIAKEAGFLMNPNSDDDVREYFFKTKKMKPLRWTDGGKSGIRKPCCDKLFLEHAADQDVHMAELLLRNNELSTIKNTYLKGWSKRVSNKGRLHTRFNQDIARTGRLSSSNPNLQNVKTVEKDEFGLRGAFIADDGDSLIVGDYEQLEMRLLGCATVTSERPEGERDLINIFLSGKDIHMGNAELVFGIPYDDLKTAKNIDKKVKNNELSKTALQQLLPGGHSGEACLKARSAIKAVGFGLNYGMKENKLARQIGTSKEEAKEIMDRYMARYPAVKDFYAAAIEETRQTGYAFTIQGRRRFLPEIASHNTYDRYQAERQAVNAQIQGTAADVVKMAMLLCDDAQLDKRYGAQMLLQVHDELVFQCPKDAAVAAKEEIKEWMEHSLHDDLIVPLDVSIGIGASWAQAK